MATYAEMQEVFADIKSDFRYDHELNGCLNCGICTATCPSAHFYDYSPREIVQLLWTENVEQIYDAMQEKIWGLRPVHDLRRALSVSRTRREAWSQSCVKSRSSTACSRRKTCCGRSARDAEAHYHRQPAFADMIQPDHFPTGAPTSRRWKQPQDAAQGHSACARCRPRTPRGRSRSRPRSRCTPSGK